MGGFSRLELAGRYEIEGHAAAPVSSTLPECIEDDKPGFPWLTNGGGGGGGGGKNVFGQSQRQSVQLVIRSCGPHWEGQQSFKITD